MRSKLHEEAPAWRSVVESHKIYHDALKALLTNEPDLIAILRDALQSDERRVALTVARSLKPLELQQLFPSLVFLASWVNHGLWTARDLILGMPRDWVLAHIEAEAEPHIEDKDEVPEDVYRRFMELYLLLDRDLLRRLIQRGQAHPDPDVREAATNFAEHLEQNASER